MDSIIFDLDGTLWDSRGVVVQAWNDVIKKYDGIDKVLTKEDLKRTMGLQMDEIGEILFPEESKEVRDDILNQCGIVENSWIKKHGGNLYPQLENTLQALTKKYQLFIVSNCQEGYIESFYQYHKLGGYFIDEENPGRTGLSKGENIQLVIERNQLSAPIYVGDTQGDKDAAAFADIPFIYASYGFGEVDGFDHRIETFAELLKVV